MTSIRAFSGLGVSSTCLAGRKLSALPVRRTQQVVSATTLAPQPKEIYGPANPAMRPPISPKQVDPARGTVLGKLGGESVVQGAVHIPFRPAEEDAKNFREHWSVQFWRDFPAKRDAIMQDNSTDASGFIPFIQKLRGAGRRAGMFDSPQAIAYWGYHLARSGFFTVQGLAGLAARNASVAQGKTGDGVKTEKKAMDFGKIIQSGLNGPLTEALASYYVDWTNIQEGRYKMPWDMTPGHRQFSPSYVLNKASRFLTEAFQTLDRRDLGKPDPVWMQSGMYPDYYLNTFHYQTDGWLSEKSASVYEVSTETLFIGRQDAMQRTAMVPLADFMRSRPSAGEGTQVLEVACGTGRFGTFLKDTYPKMQLTCSDLSPFYLAQARENHEYWRKMRQPSLPMQEQTKFLQTAAEKIAAPDNSYDVVVSVYLFHELPGAVQREAAKEMARVCKPGGMVILTDSTQLGDRPEWDATLGGFGNFNEPYYVNYIATDLGALFKQAGLECDQKVLILSDELILPSSS
ncbi:hypothetical protein WJX84_008109 [Apatococcus fuscideae]|uniref:Methyltransferase domain-containing protein n=1 Tax=Apatococcus fuscideae TaxID=2026836 RepID=A0AAW1TE45_9CHLO